jgi:hypothetical protein
MKSLSYEFTDKEVSPWGGLRLIEEVYQRSGLKQYLREKAELPEPNSNRGYSGISMVEGFIVSILLGARRLSHTGTLRYDKVVGGIFNWEKGMASQSTFSRFFRKFDKDRNDSLFPALNRWWFEQLSLDKYTIDLDSTVITRHGSQEGVEKGYNPTKPGRGSHHPLMAFVAEAKMIANAWMRTGNSVANTDFEGFFDELLTIVPKHKIGLFRADSGFYGDSVLSKFEKDDLHYIVAAKMNQGLVNAIYNQHNWFPIGEGCWVTSFYYQAIGWTKERRVAVVRKDVEKRPKTGGKLLFPDIAEFENYRYAAFVTDLNFSAEMIWSLYNQRADCENRIKELKYDYGIEGFCMEDFYATEAAFRFAMIAYNLMALFKLQVLNNKHSSFLSTVRFQCIAIGSYLTKSGRKTTLILSAKQKRKQFLEGLFSKLNDLAPPFQISIA